MGHWIMVKEAWEWYYSPSQEHLFKKDSGVWIASLQIIKRNKLPAYDASGFPTDTPTDLCRATVYKKGKHVICTGPSPLIEQSSSQPSNLAQQFLQADRG
jgi:hypothetical protein